MDNRFDANLFGELKTLLDEISLESKEENVFGNETNLFKVYFNEDKQQYILAQAQLSGESDGSFAEIQSVLFDDSQSEKDISFVAIEFSETIRQKLGVRRKRAATTEVDLPSANKNGAMTVSGFTKKVLDVFPQYKDDYKAHVAHYGNFLYLDFFADTLVPQIIEILNAGAKKTVKKLFELLETGYLQGDRETVNVTVAVIAAAVYKQPELKEKALEMLDGNAHYRQCVQEFIPVFAKRKKLIKALIK